MIGAIYELLYVCTLAIGGLLYAIPYLGMEKSLLVLCILQLLMAGIFVVYKNGKFSVRIGILGLFLAIGLETWIFSEKDSFMEIVNDNLGYLAMLGIGFGAFVLGELLIRVKWLKVLSALAALGSLIAMQVLGYDGNEIYIAAVFFFVLLAATEEIQKRWKKGGYTEPKEHLVCVTPFILLIAFFVGVGPYTNKAFGWGIIDRIYERIKEVADQLSFSLALGSGDYALSMVGFSEDSDLDGDVSDSDEIVMHLYELENQGSRIKLSGKSFSTFLGREWSDEDMFQTKGVMLDTVGTVASIFEYTQVLDNPSIALTDYIKKYVMKIKNEYINSEYVFVPLKALTNGKDFEEHEVQAIGGDLVWDKRNGMETQYEVPYFRLNTGNECFPDYLINGTRASKENYEKYLSILGVAEDEELSYEKYVERQTKIKEIYGQEIELSQELRAYMDLVYEGCQNDFEKLARLEQMLRKLKYTVSPGALPGKVNSPSTFLDYFVLESREGYCIHFATAFVLLARAEGIPVRYVQGFSVDVDGNRNVDVTSAMAHAWPEVYFDGAGWIAYEPTPGYNIVSYWQTEEEKRLMHEMSLESYEEYLQGKDDTNPYEVPDPNAFADENGSGHNSENTFFIKWYMILGSLLGVTFVVIAFVAAGNLLLLRKFRRSPKNQQFEILCKQNLRLLVLFGYSLGEGETLTEFRNGILAEKESILKPKEIKFLTDLEYYLYGGDVIIEESLEDATFAKKVLLAKIKKISKLKYIRYYLGLQF